MSAMCTVASCQAVVDGDVVQCKADGDCAARGGAFAGSACVDAVCIDAARACFGKVTWGAEDTRERRRSRIRFVDLWERNVEGLEVLVCATRDEYCTSPESKVLTDAKGQADVQVPKNFRGTFQVHTFPERLAAQDYMKMKVLLFPPQDRDEPLDVDIPTTQAVHLVPRAALREQLAARAPLDPEAGHLFGAATNCDQTPARGVTVTLRSDAGGKPPIQFYFNENNTVSTTATETFALGQFGIANVPAGPVTLETSIPSLGGRRHGQLEFFINSGFVTTSIFPPTPLP
ncbi:MAG: hypothetical protein KF819_19975 [Labilithrix sp.]|nr:hypothetical protein [Labilithrix sp.]